MQLVEIVSSSEWFFDGHSANKERAGQGPLNILGEHPFSGIESRTAKQGLARVDIRRSSA